MDERFYISGLLGATHLLYIEPVTTVAGLFALPIQAHQMKINFPRARSGLSVDGLLLQAPMFAMLGISWASRLPAHDEWYHTGHPWGRWQIWFEQAGWAFVGNITFSFVQAALYWFSWSQKEQIGVVDETTCLLALTLSRVAIEAI